MTQSDSIHGQSDTKPIREASSGRLAPAYFVRIIERLLQARQTRYSMLVVASFLLSAIAVYSQDLVNPDAVVYLGTAHRFMTSGLGGAIEEFGWPFYSILIAMVASLANLSLESAAHVLNAFLIAGFCVFFVALASDRAQERGELLASLLVLCWAGLNEYRDYLIRDHGFWCFLFAALWCLNRYLATGAIWYALCWQLAIGLAFLFRLEAIAFAGLLPFAVLALKGPTSRFARFIALTSLGWALLLLILVGVLADWGSATLEASRIPQLFVYFNPDQLLDKFSHHVRDLQDHVLHPVGRDQGTVLLLGGIILLTISEWLDKIGWLYLLILIVCFYKAPQLKGFQLDTAVLALIIALTVTFAFASQQLFLQGRYLMAAAALTLVVLANRFEFAFAWIARERSTITRFAMAVFLAVYAFESVYSHGNSKAWIKSAAMQIADEGYCDDGLYTTHFQVHIACDFRSWFFQGLQKRASLFELVEHGKVRYGAFYYRSEEPEQKPEQKEVAGLVTREIERFGHERRQIVLIELAMPASPDEFEEGMREDPPSRTEPSATAHSP